MIRISSNLEGRRANVASRRNNAVGNRKGVVEGPYCRNIPHTDSLPSSTAPYINPRKYVLVQSHKMQNERSLDHQRRPKGITPSYTPKSVLHMTEHFESLFSPANFTLSATLAASVKASLTPRFLIAEHSKYLRAPILRATSRPWL